MMNYENSAIHTNICSPMKSFFDMKQCYVNKTNFSRPKNFVTFCHNNFISQMSDLESQSHILQKTEEEKEAEMRCGKICLKNMIFFPLFFCKEQNKKKKNTRLASLPCPTAAKQVEAGAHISNGVLQFYTTSEVLLCPIFVTVF